MKKNLFSCGVAKATNLIIIIGLGFSVLFEPVSAAAQAGILYVTQSGTGDCSSWANACTLQTALTNAVSGDEIWVAAGTYKPTTDLSNRDATFQLKTGVAEYGGFAGTETARDQRNPTTNITTLSGDLNGDDVGFTNNIENVYHVVTGANGATMDGLTITAGNGFVPIPDCPGCTVYVDGGGMYNTGSLTLTNVIFSGNLAGKGGGMYNTGNPTLTNVTFSGNRGGHGGGMANYYGSSPALTNVTFSGNGGGYGTGMYNNGSSPTLKDVTFSGNSGTSGGGMYNEQSSPVLTDVTFSGNSGGVMGGGMYNGQSSPVLTHVTFSGNSAQDAGGMYNGQSNPLLTDVIFSANTADYKGGGMYNHFGSPTLTKVTFSDNTAGYHGGGMYNYWGSSPTLTDVTFSGNRTGIFGGGMYSQGGSGGSIPILTNVTFSGNSAQGGNGGGGLWNDWNSNPQIRNVIFWGNTGPQISNGSGAPVVSDSVIQDGYAGGTNIITADPLLGALGNHGGFTQTIPLLVGSSAIDTGNDAACPVTDQRGVKRPFGSHCDIGAYELLQWSVPTFSDVPDAYWAWQYIERLYNVGITSGCSVSPLGYCPDSSVTRAQMAVFILKGMQGSTFAPPVVVGGTGFTDVAIDYWAAAWIKQLAAEGITGGCGAGVYCPDATVTRAQMAVFLLKARHGSSYSPPAATGVFTDVPTGYWADKWIEQLAAEGITSGCGAGIYCPDDSVTRAQMAVFLVKAFNLP